MLDEEYKNAMHGMGMETLAYEKLANDWKRKNTEWYDTIVAIEDLSVVLAIPNLNIYAWT